MTSATDNGAVSIDCPFCQIAATQGHERIIAENASAFVIRDGFPVSLGHTLVIPKRHVGSLFETTEQELAELMVLLRQAQEALVAEFAPDAFNIGINDGAAAGQTVPHLHIHLIPRYHGDLSDPRGGVRWVIPDKADYWSGRG